MQRLGLFKDRYSTISSSHHIFVVPGVAWSATPDLFLRWVKLSSSANEGVLMASSRQRDDVITTQVAWYNQNGVNDGIPSYIDGYLRPAL